MTRGSINKLVIIDEQFERLDGHPYAYDKSVCEIFSAHGFDTVIYGHTNMLPVIRQELGAKPWFTINSKSKLRKVPVLGAVLYRTGFWKKYAKEIEGIINENDNALLFFPNVYWYNILPVAWALKNVNMPAALLYRTSIYDTIRLPKAILPVALAIIKHSVKLLSANANTHFYTDSEVIADEWTARFKMPMKVLPIPHLTVNKKKGEGAAQGKLRMYLPGGMRVEKGVQMLTEAIEIATKKYPSLTGRVLLVTQFPNGDELLDTYKQRLSALKIENLFLGHLSTEEYNNQLSLADIILLPYQVSEGYRARTSGILAEAIASSKPFVTTDGTWMSIQARKFDTGLVVQDNNPAELAEAMHTMAGNIDLYNKKAAAACDRWMETQSEEVFFTQIQSAIPA